MSAERGALGVDETDELEIDRYQAGIRHGHAQVLEHEALTAMALELTLLRAAYAVLLEELAKRERTIRAYQTVIRG